MNVSNYIVRGIELHAAFEVHVECQQKNAKLYFKKLELSRACAGQYLAY